jgi:hypothetical protein
MNNGKPLILALEYVDDKLYDAILQAFRAQYGSELLDKFADGHFWFLAISNDGGDMFNEFYEDNPGWKHTWLSE